MTRDRGFALITVVLLMIGLAVLATGLVYAASQQAAAVASVHDLSRARRGAEAAVAMALAAWEAAERSRDSIRVAAPVLAAVELEPGLVVTASSLRLSGSTFLVGGRAQAGRGALPPIRQTATRLARSLDVDSIVRALDAAVIADRVHVGAGSSVDGGADRPTGSECGSEVGGAVRAPQDSVTIATGASVAGVPQVLPDSAPERFRDAIGHLDPGALTSRARRIESPAVTPAPVEVGAVCDTSAAANWGASAGPCAGHHVLAHAADSLHIDGGYGQGVLIADRTLVLAGGFRFHGLVLALGTVILQDAAVDGVIIAPHVRFAGGRATLDRCALLRALERVPALGRPELPRRSWIPTFD